MKIFIILFICLFLGNTSYTYYRTNLLPFQSLLLECKSEFIKYPYKDWRKDNTTEDEWDHYQSAKKNYPIVKFPENFKIKFNYKNSGKFIDTDGFFKDRSFAYYTNVDKKNKGAGKNHTHFNIAFPIPKNEWDERMLTFIEVKQPYLFNEKEEKLFIKRTFIIDYLSTFFGDFVDAYYNCEEIKKK